MNEFEDFGGFDWDTFGFGFEDRMLNGSPSGAPITTYQPSALSESDELIKKSPKATGKRKFRDLGGDHACLEAEVKQLRAELKKTEKVRERLSQAEEQNALMRAELKRINVSPVDIKRKNEERIKSLQKLLRSFNAGDVDNMRHTIATLTSAQCSILTPSLFQELRGHNAVNQFFGIMLETFPDGFFGLSETVLEESGVVISKFSFTGTKVSPLPSDMLYEKWKDLSLDELYKKRIAAAGRMAKVGALQETFMSIRSAPSIPGGKAVAAAAAQNLPHDEVTSTLLECMMPSSNPSLEGVGKSLESVESERSTEEEQRRTTADATRNSKTIKISGHMITTYDASTEQINRIVFVWNTTSLLGQIFGFSDGDLEVLNGVVGSTQGPGAL